MKLITLQITTRNRLNDLKISLKKKKDFLKDKRLHVIICVDGGDDMTADFIKKNYPEIELIHNTISRGYIYCRNLMMSQTKTPFAISLDDDAHFLSDNNVDSIINHFELHGNCAVIGFRILWSKSKYNNISVVEGAQRVRSFVGCGHAWRMEGWRRIRPYPEWFEFYGEEDFASYELFKNGLEVHYFPDIFVQHRVDVNARKSDADYLVRNRRSLRSGWYLWLMFIPTKYIPKYWAYSVYAQFKNKIFKNNPVVFFSLLLALLDILIHIKKIIKGANRLTDFEYSNYLKLHPTKIYWKP
jgi:GT2 family glycosyltransferase